LELNPTVQEVKSKLIQVLSAVWNTDTCQTETYLEEWAIPNWLRDQIRVRKTHQRVVADMLKGGIGPWVGFLIKEGFASPDRREMLWVARTALTTTSFYRFLVQAAKKAINLINGEEIFLLYEDALTTV
jgi:hypothetical protein